MKLQQRLYTHTEVEKLLLEWADEVIGEDVDAYKMSGGSIAKLNIYQYQNSLKAEQRKRNQLNKTERE